MTAEIKSRELKIRKVGEIWYLEGLTFSFTLTQGDLESLEKFVKIHDGNVDFQDVEQIVVRYVSILNIMIQEGLLTVADFKQA